MTLLIFLIAMAYSVVAPIMPAIGVGYLILSWLLWRFSVLYIFGEGGMGGFLGLGPERCFR